MYGAKSVVLAIVLLLIAVFTNSSISLHNVFAADNPPDVKCNGTDTIQTCCWHDDSGQELCTNCSKDAPGGQWRCGGIFCPGPFGQPNCPVSRGENISTQPPTNVAPPKVCSDGSAPDANGKCPPVTQAPTDQGTILPPTNDNTDTKHHKGSDLGQLGGSLLNGDNNPTPSGDNNNKPSKHHKDSDTLTPPPLTDQGTP